MPGGLLSAAFAPQGVHRPKQAKQASNIEIMLYIEMGKLELIGISLELVIEN